MVQQRDHVRCITIVHPVGEIRGYRLLSAFFRLHGIFVCEKTILEPENKTDAVINLSQEKDFCATYDWFTSIIVSQMKDVFSERAMEIFSKSRTIYESNDLMRASYAIAYFFDTKKEEIYERMLDAHSCFNNALDAFKKLEDEYQKECSTEILKYVIAAKCNCMRRMNELYINIWNAIENNWYSEDFSKKAKMKEKLWKKGFIKYNTIETEISRIISIDPSFYGVYAISGFSKEVDPSRCSEYITDLLEVIKYTGSHSFSSYIYYRIGNYFELTKLKAENKWRYYEKALEVDPNNYRALYKIITRSQQEGEIEKCLEDCKNLISIIESKVIKNEKYYSLQPIECAYLFKTFAIMGKAYHSKNMYTDSVVCLKRAINIYTNRDNEDSEKGFYPWMFKSLATERVTETTPCIWPIFKEAARHKLQVSYVCKLLENVASDLGDKKFYDDVLCFIKSSLNSVVNRI